MKFLFLFIALCGYASAQTTVCSGDSVMVVLDGYKQGSTFWLESSDRTTWSKASGTSYNDSLIITATNALYYRAIVTDGTCSPFYSDTVQVVVNHPTPPTAKPASEITFISFAANWNVVAGATTYYLDVATDSGFIPSSFVSGFKNLQVSNRQITYTVTGLTCERIYYYRVRVFDDTCGIASMSSNTITVTTPACPVYCSYKSTCSGNIIDARDNKIYKTVQIGTQCWMAQNLDVGNRVDGIKPQTPGADIEKYCYDDNFVNCITYGGLYLWDEMMDYGLSDSIAPGPKGICPTDWHLPTDSEWTCLEKILGGASMAGGKLKDVGTSLWHDPNTGATNSSGFTALPGGYRSYIGDFLNKGIYGAWWPATQNDVEWTFGRSLKYDNAEVGRLAGHQDLGGLLGFSVRCVKN